MMVGATVPSTMRNSANSVSSKESCPTPTDLLPERRVPAAWPLIVAIEMPFGKHRSTLVHALKFYPPKSCGSQAQSLPVNVGPTTEYGRAYHGLLMTLVRPFVQRQLCSIHFSNIVFDEGHVTMNSPRQVRSYCNEIGAYANVWRFQAQLRWKSVLRSGST